MHIGIFHQVLGQSFLFYRNEQKKSIFFASFAYNLWIFTTFKFNEKLAKLMDYVQILEKTLNLL